MEDEELFKIDIECDDDQDDVTVNKPDYSVDFSLIDRIKDSENNEKSGKASPTTAYTECCWNCDKAGHSLRDCPLPQNKQNILKRKRAFNKTQVSSKRYHDNKFAKFRPGHHSSKLREALGIRSNEIPRHVYMMRVMGYPPGWLAEAKISNSGIKMYNSIGKRIPEPGEEDGEILNKIMKYDIEKIIEFPGFNIPPSKGVRDESRALGFPPIRPEHLVDNFIDYLEEMSKKVLDESDGSTDNESVDMELSGMLPTEIIEEVENINKRLYQIDSDKYQSSLLNETIEEGEIINQTSPEMMNSRKRSLDNETSVNKNVDNTSAKRRKSDENDSLKYGRSDDDEIEEGELDEEDSSENNSNNEKTSKTCGDLSNRPLDFNLENKSAASNTEKTDQCSELSSEKNINDSLKRSMPIDIIGKRDESPSMSSPRGSVTNSSFGTPNIKSHSPFSKLPAFENFNKDISDVIDFENLPDSVGKYGTMCTIISKIRSFMSAKTPKSENSSKKS